MRVCVTGGDGFVGRRLVPRLETGGHEVHSADRDVDVSDARALDDWVARSRPEAVVHLAAQSSVVEAAREPAETFRVNYRGAVGLLAAMARHASRARVVLVGSAEQYGPSPLGAPPTAEDAPLRPALPYARTKAAADVLGACWAQRGLDVVRVRAFNHTGPGQSDRFAPGSFARQLAEMEAGRRPPQLRVGNLDAVRDYLHVDDVVDAYARLLDRRVPAGAYNVASGRGRPLRHVLDALLAEARVKPAVEVDPARVRPADQLLGDARRLRAATGWTPQRSLEAALRELLASWRQRVSAW
jgi:GDP-4-dehydro-6-deoxy-D-mannose reductase